MSIKNDPAWFAPFPGACGVLSSRQGGQWGRRTVGTEAGVTQRMRAFPEMHVGCKHFQICTARHPGRSGKHANMRFLKRVTYQNAV